MLPEDTAISLVEVLQKSCQAFKLKAGDGMSLVGAMNHTEVLGAVTVSGTIEQGRTVAMIDFGKGAPEHFIRRVGVSVIPNNEKQRRLSDELCAEFMETFEEQLSGLSMVEASDLAGSWVPHVATLAAMMGVSEDNLAVTVAVPRVDLAVEQLRGLRPFGWVKDRVIKVVMGGFWEFAGAEVSETGRVILPRLINNK